MAPHLLDLVSNANPITQTGILEHLDPQDVLRLLATCRTLRYSKSSIWNVNRSLRRFVKDPLAFRSIMARYDAIVAGSHALQFMRRIKWIDSDLDIYVTGKEGLYSFGKYLSENDEYDFSPYSWQPKTTWEAVHQDRDELEKFVSEKMERMAMTDEDVDDTSSEAAMYVMNQINGVLNFVHQRRPELRIQIILANETPVNAILGDYYATHIFNFFTWNRAYSLFPYHTFKQNEAYYTNELTGKSSRAVEKYKDRGYEFKDYGAKHECVANCPFKPHRRIGDKNCWILDLDTEGVVPSKLPILQQNLETSTWGMKMHKSWWSHELNCREFIPMSHIKILYTWDNSDSFRYPHLIDLHSESLMNFIDQMKKSFNRLVKGYYIDFPEARAKDLKREGEEDYYLDGEFKCWYELWEKSIMPNENLWRWQYPLVK